MTRIGTIVWQSILSPGHEYCQLSSQGAEWKLEGTAIFTHGQQPCQLDYRIICDATWRTLGANILGWVADTRVEIELQTDPNQHWYLNQVEQPQVASCIDLDLNFSPSTNLIPIRRLSLAVGEQAAITAAWLRFPELALEPLPQRYLRLEELIYRYESGGGRFMADLTVNHTGFVVDYPGIWKVEDI